MRRGTWIVVRDCVPAGVLPVEGAEKQVGLFVEEAGCVAFYNKGTRKVEMVSIHENDDFEFVSQAEPVPELTKMMVAVQVAQSRINTIAPKFFGIIEREVASAVR